MACLPVTGDGEKESTDDLITKWSKQHCVRITFALGAFTLSVAELLFA
jgi:hypothetical protein